MTRMPNTYEPIDGVKILGEMNNVYGEILAPDAVKFVATLQREFNPTRESLLEKRVQRQREIDQGKLPDFLRETNYLRTCYWKVEPVPKEIERRRVEITGPASDRKMVINALNSGADCYMTDFEDSHAPMWAETIDGQINVRDAVNKTITYDTPKKKYTLNDKTAFMFVRPRGWHLPEKHMLVDGKPVSASLFDFGLFFYHNAKNLCGRGLFPALYLPKMESRLEARLWNDVIMLSQQMTGIPRTTTKATVLIETILAAFEMHEILYELKDHSAGLNCGRWDYIFSFIKKFSEHQEFVLPDRAEVTMTTHFMKSYVDLLIQTCHRRGAHAMGGMAAQIPVKDSSEANDIALNKVRADKLREVQAGHDGTWVAHPGLVPIAMEIFDQYMKTPNQLNMLREDVKVTAKDLLTVPSGNITYAGLKTNTKVGIQYTESWLRGNGCVPLYNLMEDAATAEISRSQNWQWCRHKKEMTNGAKVTNGILEAVIKEALAEIEKETGKDRFAAGKFQLAAELFAKMSTQDKFEEFLTLPAYQHL